MMRNWPLSLRLGLGLIAMFCGAALLSLIWTPYDPAAIDVAARLRGPEGGHWLGTDALGRDVLSLLMGGAANSLAVAAAAVVAGLGLGVPLGLVAAAHKGAGAVAMRFSDIVFAFPALLSAIMLTAALGPGGRCIVLAVGLFNVPVFARVVRASALVQWQMPYVLAARVAGKGRVRISLEHILPAITGPLLAQGAIQFSTAIIAEAGLSYIGLGIQPPLPSWGRMLGDAQTLISLAPHLALAPGAAIFLAVLAFHLTSDGLSRLANPKRGL